MLQRQLLLRKKFGKDMLQNFLLNILSSMTILTECIKTINAPERYLTCLLIAAILISCLGLFGLATYTAQVKTKEIGIRKVLGASVTSLIRLLSKEFIVLIVTAFVIATPVAWFFMNKWLRDFAYRININWWIFLVTGVLAIMIALITVGFQAIKAAVANPVKSLRTE